MLPLQFVKIDDVCPVEQTDYNNISVLSAEQIEQINRLRRKEPFQDENYRTLGLSMDKDEDILRFSYHVGAVWVDKNTVLAVKHKFKRLDVAEMMLACCSHTQTAEKLFPSRDNEIRGRHPAMYLWPDEPLIPLGKMKDSQNSESPWSAFTSYLDVLLAICYLQRLYSFCLRHLRRSFHPIENNLVGKVKGRVLVHNQIRENLVRCRPERISCRYTEMTMNTPANQILRAALGVAVKCIEKRWARISDRFPVVDQWMRSCLSALSEVSLVRLTPQHWSGLVFSGAMSPYRPVIQAAKALLSCRRLSNEGSLTWTGETPQFSINMSRLFELYGFSLFLKEGWKGEEQFKTSGLRPDALLYHHDFKYHTLIVDFKYYRNANSKKEDLCQIIQYAASRPVQDELERLSQRSPCTQCLFVFPSNDSREGIPPKKMPNPDAICATLESKPSWSDYSWCYGGPQEKDCRIGQMEIPLPMIHPIRSAAADHDADA